MNCIILLLLLSCCGGCGGDCGCGNTCRPVRRENRMTDGDCGCGMRAGRREPERRESCGRPEPCGCEEERPCREAEPCGCNEREREGCDGPGMIPPPWQEYPKFPHRDGGENCES